MSEETRAESGGLGPVARRLAASQRVLVIEDEPDIAAFLRAYFRASGYDLVHVDPDDVDAAIAAVEEQQPDLLLLDLRLRTFRGEEVYRRLRADDRWAFLPILIVSAKAFEGTAPGGLDGYVAKPFNTDRLAELVKEHIERAAALEQTGLPAQIGVMTEDYLRARLVDEVNAGREYDNAFTFGLVRLGSVGALAANLGDDGSTSFIRSLIDEARRQLPDDSVLGLTGPDELAVILPGIAVDEGAGVVGAIVDEIGGLHRMAGGAEVTVELAAGVAGFPHNAADPDELYMAADGALADAGPDRPVVAAL